MNRTRLATLFAFTLLVSGGCDDSLLGIGPVNELEVTNAIDQFQFQVSDLEGVTDSRTYTWQNTGTQATIDVSQAITAGTAVLTIRDAEGTVMYEADIAEDSDTTTPAGVAGSWQIDVVLNETSGTFNFRVQKTT